MRTFIFGAGASIHAGYPLASQLWRSLEEWVRSTFADGQDFFNAVDTMNEEFDLSKSFELVLTDLDERIKPLLEARQATRKGIEEKVRLVYLRSTVQTMIPLYFNSLRHKPAELYAVFADSMLSPGDAIISFNYDLALDRELKRSGKWSIGNGYGFPVRDGFGNSACSLYKLHGSTNWKGELFKGIAGFGQVSPTDLSLGQRPVIDPSEFEYLGYAGASDALNHDGRARIESIIMPTANKRFFIETSLGREWEDFWDSIWFQAGEALRISSEVYLIGYSLPEYDVRARALIAKKTGSGATIKVCCHNGTAAVIESLERSTQLRDVSVQAASATTFEGLVSEANQL